MPCYGDAFRLQQRRNEIFVRLDFFAFRRLAADRLGERRIDIEGAFRRGTLQIFRLAEHRDDEIAARLENLAPLGDESCGPLSASTEAHCAIEQAPDVCWPCSMSIALMSLSGPAA